MEWPAIVTGLALIEYLVIMGRVGAARGKYEIPAPAVTGNDIFERIYRVQINTVEQLIVFVPALWLFATYVSATVGAAIGALFLISRAIYAISYVQAPEKRTLGFVGGYLANAVLLLGGLGGAIRGLF